MYLSLCVKLVWDYDDFSHHFHLVWPGKSYPLAPLLPQRLYQLLLWCSCHVQPEKHSLSNFRPRCDYLLDCLLHGNWRKAKLRSRPRPDFVISEVLFQKFLNYLLWGWCKERLWYDIERGEYGSKISIFGLHPCSLPVKKSQLSYFSSFHLQNRDLQIHSKN